MADDAQRIADCRELYIKYGGHRHEQIEREMRGVRGHVRFCRRIMYTRRERGRVRPGWIDRFAWKKDIDALLSPKGTKIIAQGKAAGRDPGYCSPHDSDPEGVEQTTGNVAPLQEANAYSSFPGVTLASLTHPRLLSVSPSATGGFNRQTERRLRKIAQRLRSSRMAAKNPQSAIRIPQSDDPFHAWLKTQPGMWNWDWRHQLYIYDHLKRVTDGTCKRLMIFLPPRHGKSELVTVRYTAWRLQSDPSLRVILSCYNQSLANSFSRKVRRVIADASAQVRSAECGVRNEEAAAITEPRNSSRNNAASTISHSAIRTPHSDGSPFPFIRQRPANSVAEWETTMGGGLRAVGVGGGVTGFGAQLIVVDDPVKSRAEAESPKMREKVWNWFNDDLYTRLEPNGAIILIQTRWHEDDLAGRLLREMEDGGEQWEVISLPALAEEEREKGGRGEEEIRRKGEEESPEKHMNCKKEEVEIVETSPQGTGILAQGEAAGRNPGYDPKYDRDPVGVAHTGDAAPFQGADDIGSIPGVTFAPLIHPGLISGSPAATGNDEAARTPHSAFRNPQSNDPLGRSPGEALCPARFDKPALENLQRKLGTYSFSALYQQRPTPAEGMIFKREWFKTIVKQPPPGLKWTRGYDLAVSTKTTADYTASFRVAYDDEGNLYIDGGFRKRVEFPDQRRYILGRIAAEHDTEHGIELALHGQGIMQDLRRSARLQGRRFRGIAVEGDKLTRALKWSSLAEEGRVRLVRGGWNADFIDEACSFPGGQHDDQIDAVSIAVRMHERPGSRLIRF